MIRLRPLRILRTNSAYSAAISVHAPQPPSPTPPSPSPPWPPPPSPPPPPPSHPPPSPRRHGGRALLGLSCRDFVKQQRPSCKFAHWTENSRTQQHNSVARYELHTSARSMGVTVKLRFDRLGHVLNALDASGGMIVTGDRAGFISVWDAHTARGPSSNLRRMATLPCGARHVDGRCDEHGPS